MSKLKVTTISDPDNNNTALTVASDGKVTLAQDTTFSSNVGIGTSSPSSPLTINRSTDGDCIEFETGGTIVGKISTDSGRALVFDADPVPGGAVATTMRFNVDNSEAMRIDSSGNLGIGTTSPQKPLQVNGNDTAPVRLVRETGDGHIIQMYRDSSVYGNMGIDSGQLYIAGTGQGLKYGSGNIRPTNSLGSATDNLVVLGSSTFRFKDLYLSGGAYIGGTGSANYLDDYEEGTFNPTITPNTSGTLTLNSSFNTLSYVKVGNVVHIFGAIRIGSLSSPTGNNVQITTPFTVNQVNQMSTRSGSATRINFGSPSVTGIYPTYSAENSNKIYINLNPSGFAVGNDIYIGETLYVY